MVVHITQRCNVNIHKGECLKKDSCVWWCVCTLYKGDICAPFIHSDTFLSLLLLPIGKESILCEGGSEGREGGSGGKER